MRALLLIPLLLLLAACLPIPGLFYIGQLSDHDQAIFREAARIEGVDTVDWPVPGAWIVMYGAPRHNNGETRPGLIFVRQQPHGEAKGCPIAQVKFILYRHEIGHTKGRLDSSNKNSVMYNPAPCWPKD